MRILWVVLIISPYSWRKALKTVSGPASPNAAKKYKDRFQVAENMTWLTLTTDTLLTGRLVQGRDLHGGWNSLVHVVLAMTNFELMKICIFRNNARQGNCS
jgi:hypothetical protein